MGGVAQKVSLKKQLKRISEDQTEDIIFLCSIANYQENKGINDDHITKLVQTPNDRIKTLILTRNNISDIGIYFISKDCYCNIGYLSLNWNQIGKKGCKFLSRANWKDLHSLGLNGNQICDEGMVHLAKGHWKKLDIIELKQNYISKGAMRAISKATWKNIRVIYLQQNNIGFDAVSVLFTGVYNLERLYVQNNPIPKNFGLISLRLKEKLKYFKFIDI